MAEKQELEISIEEDGSVVINVIGAKGKKCLDLTKELEESLGLVSSRETKPSFYEEEINSSVTVKGTDQ